MESLIFNQSLASSVAQVPNVAHVSLLFPGGLERVLRNHWTVKDHSLGLAGSLSFFVPPPSRAFRYARGHLHVSRFARRTKKKERLHLKGEAL